MYFILYLDKKIFRILIAKAQTSILVEGVAILEHPIDLQNQKYDNYGMLLMLNDFFNLNKVFALLLPPISLVLVLFHRKTQIGILISIAIDIIVKQTRRN